MTATIPPFSFGLRLRKLPIQCRNTTKRNSFSIRHGSRLSSGKTHDKGICRIPGRGGFDGPPPERPLLFVQPPFPCLFPVFPIRRRHASQDSNPAKRGIFFLQSDFPKMLRKPSAFSPTMAAEFTGKRFPSSGEKGKTDKWSETARFTPGVSRIQRGGLTEKLGFS